MLTGESDMPAVFELMVNHRGDPLWRDAEGQNRFRIPTAFRSQRVLAWLQCSGA